MLLTFNFITLAARLANRWRGFHGHRKALRRRGGVGIGIENLEARELLTTFTVTTNVDEISVNGTTSLREAIQSANASEGEDTIVFSEGADGSIDLQFGQLLITESVSILGNGATNTVINGLNGSRVLDISAAAEAVALEGLTITNGRTTGDGEGGGGIRSLATMLTISHSAITGNSTTGTGSFGGGILAQNGDVSIISSTISGNSTSGADSGGGGVRLETGFLTVQNSTVSGNSSSTASAAGGGLSIAGAAVAVSNTTVTLNTSEGTTSSGGGIFANNSDVTLINSIVAQNTNAGAPDLSLPVGNLSIINTLIGSNVGTSLLEAQTPNGDGNLIGTSAAPIDPLLGPLAYNNSLTQTHALLTNSPAIDRGLDGLASDSSDQRGLPFIRIAGAAVDLGSFELQALSLQVTTADDENDAVFDAQDLSLREAVALANAYPGIDTISFASSLDSVPLLLTLGELSITDGITIGGSGTNLTVIDAQAASRVFNIASTATAVTLQGLSVTNGTTTGNNQAGGGIRSASAGTLTLFNVRVGGNTTEGADSPGAGIYLSAVSTLVLTNSIIVGNTTTSTGSGGAGVFAAAGGSLTVTGTTISSNTAAGSSSPGGGVSWETGTVSLTESIVSDNTTHGTDSPGGGIYSNTADLSVTHSTISGNYTTGDDSSGGGLFADEATVTLDSSTVSENFTNGVGSLGGGIAVANGELSLVNSTISTNATYDVSATGAGIAVAAADLSLINCTVAFNSSEASDESGGGISAETGDVTILNTIVAKNTGTGAPDLAPGSGTLVVQFSIIGENTGTGLAGAELGNPDANGNLIGTAVLPIDPQLGLLAAYTGMTETHVLQGNSPAINAGSNALAVGLTVDQRGLPRFFNSTVDIGAFEHQSIPAEPDVSFSAPTLSVGESGGVFVITVNLSFASPRNTTIPYSTGGTAARPADYLLSTGPLVISAGATSGTITITIVDDGLFESNETAVITMGVPTNAGIGQISEHIVTITNNDNPPVVSVGAATVTVNEVDGVATITATLSAASGQDVSLPFTVGGSASNGSDYSIGASPLVIAAGETTGTITIALVDDSAIELLETVTLNFDTPTGATLGGTSAVTVTIVDDDNEPPVLGEPGPAPRFRYNPRDTRFPVNVFSDITVSDPDGATHLARVVISVSIPSGKKNYDTIGFSGASALGTVVDTKVGGRRQFSIDLDSDVTTEQVQSFLRGITFYTRKTGLRIATREFQVQVTDRGGLTSNLVTQNVAVSKT